MRPGSRWDRVSRENDVCNRSRFVHSPGVKSSVSLYARMWNWLNYNLTARKEKESRVCHTFNSISLYVGKWKVRIFVKSSHIARSSQEDLLSSPREIHFNKYFIAMQPTLADSLVIKLPTLLLKIEKDFVSFVCPSRAFSQEKSCRWVLSSEVHGWNKRIMKLPFSGNEKVEAWVIAIGRYHAESLGREHRRRRWVRAEENTASSESKKTAIQ